MCDLKIWFNSIILLIKLWTDSLCHTPSEGQMVLKYIDSASTSHLLTPFYGSRKAVF